MIKVDVPEGKSGAWRVERFIIPNSPTVESIRCALHGRRVEPGTFTRLMCEGVLDPVRSDTRAEVFDLLGFIHRASGRVLINGLGLGLVLKGLLQQGKIEHIDVVELERDVIDLVWPTYQADSRLTLYQGDAYTIQWPLGMYWNFAWHDIWPTICTDNLQGVTKLKRKYAHRVGWQGAWNEERLRYLKKKEEER